MCTFSKERKCCRICICVGFNVDEISNAFFKVNVKLSFEGKVVRVCERICDFIVYID